MNLSDPPHSKNDDGPPPAYPRDPRLALDPPGGDFFDPVIEFYKKDVDRTLLRENLKLTVEQRILKAQSFIRSVEAWREAGRLARDAEAAKSNTEDAT